MTARLSHQDDATRGPARPQPGERASLLVEAAFAIPVFLMLLLGSTDLGRAALQTSQATSGAADAGRQGVVLAVLPDTANCTDDASYQRLIESVRARIPNRSMGCENVIVSCLKPSGAVVNCLTADPLNDKIRVTVRWEWISLSPFGDVLPVDEIEGQITMQLVPQPLPPPTVAPVP